MIAICLCKFLAEKTEKNMETRKNHITNWIEII